MRQTTICGNRQSNGNGATSEGNPAPDFTRQQLIHILATFPGSTEHRKGPRLAGANLAGLDLSGLNLAHADLSNANLRGANLTRCDISGADFHQADLREADLSGAFADGGLAGQSATFRDADLTGAKADGTSLIDANFEGADLSAVTFNRALLQEASFWGAKLDMAMFKNCLMSDAKMDADHLAAFEGTDTSTIRTRPDSGGERQPVNDEDDERTAREDGLHPDFTRAEQHDADGDACCIPVPKKYTPALARPGMPVQYMADGSGEQGIITHCLPDVAVVMGSEGQRRAVPWSGVEIIFPEPDPAFIARTPNKR